MKHVCCICGSVIRGFGHNPDPVDQREEARCCWVCNVKKVIPARMK